MRALTVLRNAEKHHVVRGWRSPVHATGPAGAVGMSSKVVEWRVSPSRQVENQDSEQNWAARIGFVKEYVPKVS